MPVCLSVWRRWRWRVWPCPCQRFSQSGGLCDFGRRSHFIHTTCSPSSAFLPVGCPMKQAVYLQNVRQMKSFVLTPDHGNSKVINMVGITSFGFFIQAKWILRENVYDWSHLYISCDIIVFISSSEFPLKEKCVRLPLAFCC